MKKLENAKNIYNATKIPAELPYKVNKSFKITKEKRISIYAKRTINVLATLSACCIVFIVLVNTNSSFAKAIEEIPVLSQIANLITINKIDEITETDVIHANIPNIANTGNTEFETKLNQKINEKINQLIATAKKETIEFKKMLEDYEEDYEFQPIHINVDYEIKSQNNGIVSFVITEQQSDKMHANVHQQKFMYTIDLNQNKELTLQDLLGKNYKEIANKQIKNQIDNILKKDPAAFFKKEDMPDVEHGWAFEGIEDNQLFYLNEKGNVVIVFEKYSISPGYMGMPEFEIF